MDIPIWFWIGFGSFLVGMLALDLGVFHRTPHAVGFGEALTVCGGRLDPVFDDPHASIIGEFLTTVY